MSARQCNIDGCDRDGKLTRGMCGKHYRYWIDHAPVDQRGRMGMELLEFILNRLDEDEAWAQAAIQTPGATHWHWVDSETDEPLVPDPFTQAYITEDGAGTASLRTVEELRPVSWEGGSPLPDFVIRDGEAPAGAAGHIARHDPARVLAEVKAKRAIVELHGDVDPCDAHDGATMETVACDTLRALASVYSSHESWRPEWAL